MQRDEARRFIGDTSAGPRDVEFKDIRLRYQTVEKNLALRIGQILSAFLDRKWQGRVQCKAEVSRNDGSSLVRTIGKRRHKPEHGLHRRKIVCIPRVRVLRRRLQ